MLTKINYMLYECSYRKKKEINMDRASLSIWAIRTAALKWSTLGLIHTGGRADCKSHLLQLTLFRSRWPPATGIRTL